MSKLIINCETNEITERELNKTEKDQQKIDEAQVQARQIELDARATERQELANRLNLTLDELQLLLG